MIRIRKATGEDAEAVSQVVQRCYEGFQQTDGWSAELIEELKNHRGSVGCIRGLIKARLYQEIGKLKVDLDFLKKKSGLLG